MNQNQLMSPEVKLLTDYIYEKPENVVLVLNRYGYNIDVKKTTLSEISAATLSLLYDQQNKDFEKEIIELINSTKDEYNNFVPIVLAGVSLATSLFTSFSGAKLAREEGRKNRELQKNLALMDLAFRDKLEFEKLRVKAETERNQILLNSLKDYRMFLQSVSTQRIKDTWVFIAAAGVSVAILFGISLFFSKKEILKKE
jgi:hypothetical protein